MTTASEAIVTTVPPSACSPLALEQLAVAASEPHLEFNTRLSAAPGGNLGRGRPAGGDHPPSVAGVAVVTGISMRPEEGDVIAS